MNEPSTLEHELRQNHLPEEASKGFAIKTDTSIRDPHAGEASMIRFEAADLAAYLDRIGFAGPASPDLATLRVLLAHHVAAIPFENIDPLFHRTPDLSSRALVAKLVHGLRGGYCFEQNGLLLGMLQHIGFEAHGLAARVHWMLPPTEVQPRSHMLIHVALPEGPYIADVGFGGMTPTGPLQLEADLIQATPHEPFRLVRAGAYWLVQALVADQWSDVYRFDLTRQIPADYRASNYYLSNSDDSFFTQGIVAARHLPGRRLTLGNRSFTIYRTSEPPERQMLPDAGTVCDVLEREFGIRLTDRDALISRLETKGV